jgi:hypothetical protein
MVNTAHCRNYMRINCSVQRTRASAAPPSHCWRLAIPGSEEVVSFLWRSRDSFGTLIQATRQEFTKRHVQVRYKVHELISARLKIEQSAAADYLTDNTRHHEGGFFKRLFRHRSSRSQSARYEARWSQARVKQSSGEEALPGKRRVPQNFTRTSPPLKRIQAALALCFPFRYVANDLNARQ